jgi:S-adenosylmethionine hydrolase
MPTCNNWGVNGIVTVLSDFGTRDGYAGAMKGVLCREHAAARVVDLTHEIDPGDVLGGAFALAQAAPCFPSGTVHLAVVDPGVGSARRALVVEEKGSLFVGPDNGLLTLAARGDAWAIDRIPPEWDPHPTFHGRDLFARVAGRLAAGAAIGDFSTGKVDPIRIGWDAAKGDEGEVVHVDRFGNLITNFAAAHPAQAIAIGGTVVPRVRTYSDVARGELLAYLGSAGWLEIAVRDGSASERLRIVRGAKLRARR